MKKRLLISTVLLLLLLPLSGCQVKPKGTMILATTTSTQDSGLLDELLPAFTKATGWSVDVIAVGSGKALSMGANGEADALLVHAPADELKLEAEGKVINRHELMYNDFVILGPKTQTPMTLEALLSKIQQEKLPFISRGDDSGTHKAELKLWKAVSIDPTTIGESYISAGQGMGATLTMANEMQGFVLSDRATYLSYKDKIDLVIVCEGDDRLFNPYGVMQVNPTLNDKIKGEAGEAFVKWMISKEAINIIKNFGVEKYGAPLFTPLVK